MPAPTAYTETTIKQFVVDELGAAGVALSLTTASAQVVAAVYAVERLVGAAIADQTDMAKLEAIARWQGWRAASNAAITQFDVSLTGGKKFVRSQIWDHIQSKMAEAEAAASVYSEVADALAGSGGMAYVSGTSMGGSPYSWPRDEWSV